MSTMDNSVIQPPARPAGEVAATLRLTHLQAAVVEIGEAMRHLGDLMIRNDRNDETCTEDRGRAALHLRRAAWRIFYATIDGFTEAEERWFQVDRGEAVLVSRKTWDNAQPAEGFISKAIDPCLEKREPDEPMFILLGRDSVAPRILLEWAHQRELEIVAEVRPDIEEERRHIQEVRDKVAEFRAWRAKNR